MTCSNTFVVKWPNLTTFYNDTAERIHILSKHVSVISWLGIHFHPFLIQEFINEGANRLDDKELDDYYDASISKAKTIIQSDNITNTAENG